MVRPIYLHSKYYENLLSNFARTYVRDKQTDIRSAERQTFKQNLALIGKLQQFIIVNNIFNTANIIPPKINTILQTTNTILIATLLENIKIRRKLIQKSYLRIYQRQIRTSCYQGETNLKNVNYKHYVWYRIVHTCFIM